MLFYKNVDNVFSVLHQYSSIIFLPLTLRRCLFIIEKSVGYNFNWTSGQARFLYSEAENRFVF